MKSKNPKFQKLRKGLTVLMLLIVMFSTSLLTVISYATEEMLPTGSNSAIVGGQTTGESANNENESLNLDNNLLDAIESDEESEYESVIIDSENLKNQLEKYGLLNYEDFLKMINDKKTIDISKEVQLRALALYVAEGGITSGKTFRLTKNIALSSDEWTPIGNSQYSFKGIFDGAGYTISNIVISKKQSYAGLFGYISGATIKNLNIGNSNINMNLDITSKYLSDVKKEKNVYYSSLGAIAGYAKDSEIKNCKNAANVLGGQLVGGIVGSSLRTNISDCSNSGRIEAFRTVGGITGGFYGNDSAVNSSYGYNSILRCKNTGTIIGILENAGGISGSLYRSSKIEKCLNTGNISIAEEHVEYYTSNGNKIICTSPQNVGGIVGWASGKGDDAKDISNTVYINNCINDVNAITKGYQDVGGIVGQLGGANGGKAYASQCISYSNNISANNEKIYTAGKIAGCVGVRGTKTKNSKNVIYLKSIGYISNCYYILSEKENSDNDFENNSTLASKKDDKYEIRAYGVAARLIEKNENDKYEQVYEAEYSADKKYNYIGVNVENANDGDNTIKKDSLIYKISKNKEGKYTYIDCYKDNKVSNSLKITNDSNKKYIKIEDFNALKNLLRGYGCKITDVDKENNKFKIVEENINGIIDSNSKISIDTTSPQIAIDTDISKVTLYLNSKEVNGKRFAKVGDKITIKIEFDELVNIGSSKPKLKLAGDKSASYVRLDEKNIFYTYTVTGDEEGATIGTSMKLLGTIKDIFENRTVFSTNGENDNDSEIVINPEKDITILKSNVNEINLTTSDGKLSYKISGFIRGKDGNYYYNGKSRITIKAVFTGKIDNDDLDDIKNKSKIIKLKIKTKLGNEFEIGDLNADCKNEENFTITYTIDPDKLLESNNNLKNISNIMIKDIYLKIDKDKKVTINNEEIDLKEENTCATISDIKLYVDIAAPKLKSIAAKAAYPNDNNKYTSGDEILIDLVIDKKIDLSESNIPEVNVHLGEENGKFNNGKAEFIEAIENKDKDDEERVESYTCKYRYLIQPGDEGILKVDCTGKLVDFAGNENDLSATKKKQLDNITADTTSPTVDIKAQKVEGENKTDITNSITNAEILEYTFDWSEEVKDFTVEDITINGGKVKEGTTLTQNTTDKTKYTLQVEPNVSKGNVGEIEVIVEAGVCKDDVSLENIAKDNKITIDKKAPNLINYEVSKTDSKIMIKAIFDEAIGKAHTTDIEIKFGENNANGTISTATIDVNDNRIVNYVYNISGADEGTPTIILKQNKVKDIAGNSNNIADTFENDIKLEKHVLKVDNNEYSFAYKKDGENGYTPITDFSQPTYLKAGEKIKVTRITGQVNTSYEYEVEDGKYSDNTHMTYMELIEAQENENVGKIKFSNNKKSESIEISDANIYFDTKAPTVTLISSVEEPLENNVYAKGTKIIITANISENILDTEDIPAVKVSFSKSGTGKYNYHGNSGSNAQFISSFEVVDEKDELEYIAGWEYVYVVTEGDEGDIILDYASDLTISDLAGNKTSLTGYPNAPETSIKTEDLTNKEISGKETTVTYEFYKGNSKITDFTQNTYYKKGDKIRVDVEFSNELYSSWGSTTTAISKNTAPKLIINNKEFIAENVTNNKKISYTYTVNNDENMQLTKLQLKCNNAVYAKKSNNTYEEISGNITENLDISNANLYIYNNSTKFDNNNIKADTTAPTVAITAEKVEDTSNTAISNNTTNASKLIYTFTWSEEVVGFTAEDITVNDGTKGTLSTATKNQNGTYSYTMEITPNVENGNEGQIQVIVEQNACQDLVGQSNVRTESIIRVDKKSPIFIGLEAYAKSIINLDSNVDTIKQYYKEGDTVTVIATFSENISEKEKTKIVLEFSKSGNAKGIVSEATIDGNKLKYTYIITDKDNGKLSVKGFTGKVVDSAGNETIVTKRELSGDTIIADTIAPTLKELKVVSPAEGAYKAEQEITIEASFDEEIYLLENNEIKNITSENAPVLKLKFGSGSEKTATAIGYGETAGKEDKTKIRYTYTIVDGDNGDLSITSYENKENVNVCDIAGNVVTLNKNQTGNTITADTIRPTVENITAVVENPTIENTGIYHKAGNEIKITVTFSEKVNSAVLQPKIQVGFSENENEEPTTYKDKSYESDWNVDSETVEYTYVIEEGDNGYLWVKVPENQFEDEAGNKNIAKEGTKLSNIYADTTIPTVTLYRDTEETQNNQIITVKARFNESVYDLDNDTRISLTNSNAPKLIYSFGAGKNQEVGASSISNEIITYTITKDSVKDNGDLHYELAKGNLCDRAGNELYKSSLDTTAPELEDVYITSDSTYGEFCKQGVNVKVIAQFNEDISNQKMEIKFKVGQGTEQTISGNIDDEDKTKIVFNYQVKAGDNGEFTILDVQGNTLDDEKATDKTYGYVRDEYGNQKNIFNFDGITIRGKAIADTIKPYITKVEAKVDNRIIASYTKEEGKDAITTVGKTNVNVIEYVITFSELVNYKNGMQVYNGTVKEITNNDLNQDGYYDQVTLKVQPTVEGVQSLIISDGVFEDRAGNGNNSERFNLVTTDFTKPTIRFISEYNGGIYVLPTNIGKVEVRPNIEINEDIAKIEYKWNNEDYAEINNYSTSSDIVVPTKAFTEAGTYILSIKATDLAGNISETSKTYNIVNSNINIALSNEKWTNEDIIVTVVFGEGLTDNRKVIFKSENTGNTVQLNAIGTDTDGNPRYLITENGTIYAEATDRVGNKVFTEKIVTNIDKEVPVVEIDLNKANLIIGTGKDSATIKTNVKVEDNKVLDYAKFAYIQKYIDITNISAEDKALIATNLNNEAKTENAESTKDKTPYYLYVIAKDKAGNETIEKAGPFTVLDTNEREKVIAATENSPETKEKVPAEIEISKLIAFAQNGKHIDITYNNFGDNEEYLNIIREKEITLSNDEDGFIDYENNSYVDINKPTTIKVVGKDVCGNEVVATYEITRDMIEGPEFEVHGNPEVWTNQDIKLEVYCNEELSALTVNGNDILSKDKNVRSNIVVTENGDYKFVATDIYGITSEKTIKVTKIDKDNPVISKTEAAGKTIIITAEDATSEVEKYAITDTTELPVEWSDSNEIQVTHDGEWFAWAIDKAGNYIRTENVIMVDTIAPTVEIDLNKANLIIGTGKDSATIKTNVKVEDNKVLDYAKFAYIQKDIDITNISAEDKALIATNLNNEAKIENAMSTKGKTPYYLYVIAKDKVGNETIEKAGPFTVLDTNERENVIEATETTQETKETIPAEIEISKLIAFAQKGKHVDITYNNFGDNEEYLNIIIEKEIILSNDEDGFIDYENYSYVDVNKATTITVIGKDACGNEVVATYEVLSDTIEGPEFKVLGNPEVWTNQDIKLEVYCEEELSALTVNENDILSKNNSVRSNIIVTENGDYKFVATDIYGITTEKTIKVTKIDKDNPVISKTETAGKTITITAEDATSEVEKYAITDTTELPVEWSDSNVIEVTHDGTFYAWTMDKAGNYVRTEETTVVDTTAPTITFNYTLLTVEAGLPINANIITDEEAKISYSWDEKAWETSEEFVTSVKVNKKYDIIGKYTLYAKATDKFGNESKIQTIEFSVEKLEEIQNPKIIFEDLPTMKVDGAYYVKVAADMTIENVTNKMDKKALCNVAPEYKGLTEDKKLKTGSEISLNGETKYIIIVNGDVNGDGKVGPVDVTYANSIRLNKVSANTIQKLAADFDLDGIIKPIDITMINSYRLGKIKGI